MDKIYVSDRRRECGKLWVSLYRGDTCIKEEYFYDKNRAWNQARKWEKALHCDIV